MPCDQLANRGIAIAAIIVTAATSACAVQPALVHGNSMSPTFAKGDRTAITRIVLSVKRGDIVAAHFPHNETKSLMTRIIGLPGERIAIQNGQVVIDDKPLDEAYVAKRNRSHETLAVRQLGADEYFVMGDNRRNSSDSRSWGSLRRRHIWAKVVFQ
jgi:signal peptidase I